MYRGKSGKFARSRDLFAPNLDHKHQSRIIN